MTVQYMKGSKQITVHYVNTTIDYTNYIHATILIKNKKMEIL